MKVGRGGLTLFGLALAALAVSCGKHAEAPGQGRAQSHLVEVVPAELRAMARTVPCTGTLAAQEKSILSAKVPGRLERLEVDLGSVVRQGDLLAQVELRDYELGLQQSSAALAQARTALGLLPEGDNDKIELDEVSGVKQAKAVLEEAGKNRDRVLSLAKSGIAPQSEVDTVDSVFTVAQTRFETALQDARTRMAAVAQRRAELEAARKRLADASIYAPFNGAVQSRTANIGEYLAAGTPILELVKTDPLRLRLQVPERDSTAIGKGQNVRLLVEGDTNVYRGQIARLSPALDEQSRMLLVEADVPLQGCLRPGLFARAQIVVTESEQGLSVPASALVVFAGLEKVVVIREGKALEKVITTGRRGANWVEVVAGLNAGEQVISNPSGLRTGTPVEVGKPAQAKLARQTEPSKP